MQFIMIFINVSYFKNMRYKHQKVFNIYIFYFVFQSFRERMLKLCRICGNPGLLNIYNLYDNNCVSLANKINSFLTLQASISNFDIYFISLINQFIIQKHNYTFYFKCIEQLFLNYAPQSTRFCYSGHSTQGFVNTQMSIFNKIQILLFLSYIFIYLLIYYISYRLRFLIFGAL